MWQHFWNLRVNERLAQWKDFRRTISDLPFPQAIEEVNQLWSTAPFVPYYLEESDPTTWPDPWELLAENYYCDVAKALGILYTIYFSGHKTEDIELRTYYDYNDKYRYNVVWLCGGKYILNYHAYEIVNTKQIDEQKLDLLYQYSSKDLQLDKY
jgi:alpha-ketoglutarate-dependent taurine dioxygenase